MAVVNTKGVILTNIDAVPSVHPDVTINGARQRAIVDTVSVAAADDDTSVYRFARVHSSWCIPSIILFFDGITGGTSFDVGLYQIAENGGAVVDADAYGSAINLSSANTTGLQVAFEARDIIKIQNRVWQDAGLSADPNLYYDVALTANTVGTAQGDIAMHLTYLID